jgi:hypothetical protein
MPIVYVFFNEKCIISIMHMEEYINYSYISRPRQEHVDYPSLDRQDVPAYSLGLQFQ